MDFSGYNCSLGLFSKLKADTALLKYSGAYFPYTFSTIASLLLSKNGQFPATKYHP